MALTYTGWPAVSDLRALALSSNVTLPDAATDDLLQMRLDAAIQELTQRTHRQFLPDTEASERRFDGSGTGEMLVDEYVEVDSITLYLVPSVGVTEITQFVEVDRSTYPKTRLQIYQGPANAPYGWFTYFPQGRSNVAVTAKWGYGATIPADVWQGVLYKATAEALDANRLTKQGLISSVRDDDQTVSFSDKQNGWREAFDSVCVRYNRPLRQTIGRKRPPLL
jgi:hypothetical protein